MNVNKHVSDDINAYIGGKKFPCTGFAPDALPEASKPVLAESSQTGVSPPNVLRRTILKTTKKQIPETY